MWIEEKWEFEILLGLCFDVDRSWKLKSKYYLKAAGYRFIDKPCSKFTVNRRKSLVKILRKEKWKILFIFAKLNLIIFYKVIYLIYNLTIIK